MCRVQWLRHCYYCLLVCFCSSWFVALRVLQAARRHINGPSTWRSCTERLFPLSHPLATFVSQLRWLCKYEKIWSKTWEFLWVFNLPIGQKSAKYQNWPRDCDTRLQWFIFNCDFNLPSLFSHSFLSLSVSLFCWLATSSMRQWWMTAMGNGLRVFVNWNMNI